MTTSETGSEREIEVVILGAGVCGIAALAGCLRDGIDDVVVLDRSDAVGGTWHHNVYPGCAVDIPTHVYSFSWAPNPDWSRLFAPQREVQKYLADIVAGQGFSSRIQLGVEVLEVRWDDSAQRWLVNTSAGRYRARHFVCAAGPLHEPLIPQLPGLETFRGPMFHSSQWRTDLNLDGERVVVLGTGASALQFVPAIQPRVKHLTVLQRTPSWVMPKIDWNVSRWEKAALRRWPSLMRLVRWALWGLLDVFTQGAAMHPRAARALEPIGKWHIRRSIKDPAMRRALTPTYRPTCKRLGLSNDFYRALAAPNVDLVTSPAAELREHSVVTADGQEFDADIVILGTGFKTMQNHPINRRIIGRDGRSLDEVWQGNPTAYMGTTVPGFPNAYIMFGPNVGTLSGFVMAEAQTDYLVGAIHATRRGSLASLEVTPEALADFVRHCDKVLAHSTFVLGGCQSYYLDQQTGTRASLPWPGTMTSLRRTLSTFDQTPYVASRPSITASER